MIYKGLRNVRTWKTTTVNQKCIVSPLYLASLHMEILTFVNFSASHQTQQRRIGLILTCFVTTYMDIIVQVGIE